jgi:hypothetical protein
MRLYLLLILLLVACSTQTLHDKPHREGVAPAYPMMPPPANFCQLGQTEHCRKFTASDIVGPVVRGHGEESQ